MVLPVGRSTVIIMKRFNNSKGSMLVILIVAMTLIAALGATFISMVSVKQQGFTLLLSGYRANMIAKAGVEWAIRFASEGNPVSGSMPFVSGSPQEEGSFSTSYNDTTDVLTVDGVYRGTTQRITLSHFRRYLKIGDVSFPLSMASFKPVESLAGQSITVEPTGVIRLGQGVSDTSGAVWYGGNSAAGNCVNGRCNFGSGFRAYFIFQFAPGSTGDGFTFAIINGTYNTENSVGGDPQAGELMGYGGDSRLYSGGYINSFVDSLGYGLRPPKFGVEFDIFSNNECSLCNGRCDPSNEHMAYVFWGDDKRISCKDNYTRWITSFSFLSNTVIYGTTGQGIYLYRSMNDLKTGITEPTWPAGKGSAVTESGIQWQECSWRISTSYNRDEVVAPKDPTTSASGYFFRESASGSPLTDVSEPNWTNCLISGAECIDYQARWQNAYFYDSPQLFINYATNSRTYDDNKHGAGTGIDEGNSLTLAGPTNTTLSGSYYKNPANPTTWLADTGNSSTVNRTYAFRMEVVRNSTTGTYQIKSWIKTCDPTVAAWGASTAYAINDQVKPTVSNGYYFIVKTAGISGSAEPVWSSPNPDGTISDGTVTWVRFQIPPAPLTFPTWSASTAYAIDTQVRPTVNKGYYYIARTVGTSGTTEPAWRGSGTIADGTVTWVPTPMTICDQFTNGM
jgi:hypothetical protein